MEKWNLKTIIGFGIGLTVGGILYDFIFHDNINWLRAIFSGILVMIMMFVVKQIKSEKKNQ